MTLNDNFFVSLYRKEDFCFLGFVFVAIPLLYMCTMRQYVQLVLCLAFMFMPLKLVSEFYLNLFI